MPSSRTMLITAVMLVLMLVGAMLGLYTNRYYHTGPEPGTIPGLLWPNPKQLVEFTTIDHTGKPFGLERLTGRWSLLFFGYTFCPDVCPLTLSVLAQLEDRLRQQNADPVQTIFITVDPGRDNDTRLAEYVAYFSDSFTGLGGSDSQVSSLASQIGIVHSLGPAEPDGNYPVNHSGSVFLIDPAARLVGIFSAPHDVETLLTRIQQIRTFVAGRD